MGGRRERSALIEVCQAPNVACINHSVNAEGMLVNFFLMQDRYVLSQCTVVFFVQMVIQLVSCRERQASKEHQQCAYISNA